MSNVGSYTIVEWKLLLELPQTLREYDFAGFLWIFDVSERLSC